MSSKIEDLNIQTFTEKIENGKGLSMVDFWAPWCAPCRFVTPIMEELSVELKGQVKFYKVNVDDFGEIAAKFNISGIPTMILFKDGDVATMQVGAAPKKRIMGIIQNHLEE